MNHFDDGILGTAMVAGLISVSPLIVAVLLTLIFIWSGVHSAVACICATVIAAFFALRL